MKMGTDASKKLLGQHFKLQKMNTVRSLDKTGLMEFDMTQRTIKEEDEDDSLKESDLDDDDD